MQMLMNIRMLTSRHTVQCVGGSRSHFEVVEKIYFCFHTCLFVVLLGLPGARGRIFLLTLLINSDDALGGGGIIVVFLCPFETSSLWMSIVE